MHYLIRLNPRAFNPVTRKVIPSRLWEIEQTATRDSERVIWHAHDVRIGSTPVRDLYALPQPGAPPWEVEAFGVCVRGQDNVVEIHTGAKDASGN